MKQRISAGAIVVHEKKILLVNHKRLARYDFWVAPGGGVEGLETLEETAIREVKEESGIDIRINRLAYIEELYNKTIRICKFWFIGDYIGGELRTDEASKLNEFIVGAKFLARDEIRNIRAFPSIIRDGFWTDFKSNLSAPRYLGLHEMDFF